MQRKLFGNLLIGAFFVAAVFLFGVGCSNPSSGGSPVDDDGGPFVPVEGAPDIPVLTIWDSVGFKRSVMESLNTITDDIAKDLANRESVIGLSWKGDGALTWNVYWSEDAIRPSDPNLAGLTHPVAFATGLLPETPYFFWVEAINPKGNNFSARGDRTTQSLNVRINNNSSGVERGDYPRISIVPGAGQLTVSWNTADRSGWYEVYYAEKGTIPYLNEARDFKVTTAGDKPGAIDVSSDYGGSCSLSGVDAGILTTNPRYMGGLYWLGSKNGATSPTSGDPVLGIDEIDGKFGFIGETWMEDPNSDFALPPLQPYQKLHSAFDSATPWDGEQAGTPGTPIPYYSTTTTITGLTDGKEYDVWVRVPNANGERGYGVAVGVPGVGNQLPSPSGVIVAAPAGLMRTLDVTWTPVADADAYRIYTSTFEYTPNANATYVRVSEADASAAAYTHRVTGLKTSTNYYVWVVAERNGTAGVFGSPEQGSTLSAPASGHIGDKVIVGTNEKVTTAVYVEVNDHNPLNAGSYILEDGTYLFDYVILFAANIRQRSCTGSEEDGYCTESGPHVHFNKSVRYILENRNRYLKPLQDKGIKVLLCLLGDHDGISFGSMTDNELKTFTADLKRDIEYYGLDGVDFDDEWASKEDWDNWTNNYQTISPTSIWPYPISTWAWPANVIVYRDPTKGIGPGNGMIGIDAPPPEEMDRMWRELGLNFYKTIKAVREALGPDKIIGLYEYNGGRYITQNGYANGEATAAKLNDLLDFALQPWYNDYLAESANGLSRKIYSPFGMDLGGNAYAQGGYPLPPPFTSNLLSLMDTSTRFKEAAEAGNPYNMLYFYALTPSSQLLRGTLAEALGESPPSMTKEEYLSVMTEIVFDQKTVLTAEGGDYTKNW